MSIFNKKISAADVLNYLKENPNFFVKHPEILEILEIEHASGEATSLIEKQVEIIKKKNLDVTNKLSEFLENAEHNQNLFLKIQNLILKIISQTNLNDLADFVESFFQEELKTEICKIYFFTPENSFNLETKRVITPEIATSIFSDLFKTTEISLGGLNNETSSLVFGAQANIVEGAIGKLKSSKIAGTLALGSSEIGKFPKDSETLFLEFVIAVFSNQIDKILPSTNE
ncbi:DUF484 family protein [SAR86 cluster bacterium]|nr:DUF484 family protein [SAR86 cluster bacterium]